MIFFKMMLDKTLILYSSIDGQTKKIINYILNHIEEDIANFDIIEISTYDSSKINLNDYHKILVASSIRYGKHHPEIINFVNKNYIELNSKHSAFISVNLVARKAEKSKSNTNPYVSKFLEETLWKPNLVSVFAGVLNYKAYSFWDRIMIQIIMMMTKGPTKSSTNIEYTKWEDVDEFVTSFKNLSLKPTKNSH